MDLVLTLNTDESDVRLARVVSPTDLARLPVPVLTFGDTLNVSIGLINRAGAYIAKSSAVDLARVLRLGVRGQPALAETEDFEISGNLVTCTLSLTTTQLALYLRATNGRSLALQFRTTSDSDGPETWLSSDLTIIGEVDDPDSGADLSPAVYLTLAAAVALYSPRGAGTHASANASGTTTIAPDIRHQFHTEVVTVSGAGATTRSIVLATTNRVEGDRVLVLLDLPATAGITVNFYNDDTGNPVIAGASRTTDDSGDDIAAEFVLISGAFRKARLSYPA